MSKKTAGIGKTGLLIFSLVLLASVPFTSAANKPHIEDLPNRYPEETSLNISGTSGIEGTNTLILYARGEDTIVWREIDRKQCTGVPCRISSEFTSDSPQQVSFILEAKKPDGVSYSRQKAVQFTRLPQENPIESVELDASFDAAVGTQITLNASAEGEKIGFLKIQKKLGPTWLTIETESCGDSRECQVSTRFTASEAGVREFRARARTDGHVRNSEIREITFYRIHNPVIERVEIYNLPRNYATGEQLKIKGSAEGEKLSRIWIQKRKSGDENWSNISEKSCNLSDRCTIVDYYSSDREKEVNFRVKAKAGDKVSISSSERVEFTEKAEEPEISSVTLEELPNQYRTEKDIDIEAKARGEKLDSLKILKRSGDSIRWREVKEEDCNQNDRCSLTKRNFRASNPGKITFVARAVAGTEVEYSDRETVDFRKGKDNQDRRVKVDIVSLSYPEKICRGENLEVKVLLSNNQNHEETIVLRGSGLGAAGPKILDIEDIREVELVFRKTDEIGIRKFRIHIENSFEETRNGSIRIRRCVEEKEQDNKDRQDRVLAPSGLSVNIDPRKVISGETVKISGDIAGVKRTVEVGIEGAGFSRRVSSTRSGSFKVFIEPEKVGSFQIQVSASGFHRTRTLEVLPEAKVGNIDAPGTVIEGRKFEICAKVYSQITPKVILLRNGKVLDSRNEKGKVCFETSANGVGETTYTVRAVTYGSGSSASKQVKVLESGDEVSVFPEKITTLTGNPGIIKVELYNKGEKVSKYRVEIENLPESWMSQDRTKVVLPRGERKTVYLYVTPKRSGEFQATVSVNVSGKEILRKEVSVEAISKRDRKSGYREALSFLPWV
ncbi:MAG: hypothetical protein ABEJ36_04060 [Candidatus Nanosalina sp.]